MGQVNLNIPSGGFALLNKPNPKGEKCIYLRYYISKYIKRSTDIWVREEDWDSMRQRIKGTHPHAARLNSKLQLMKDNCDAQLLELKCDITPEVISEVLDGKNPANSEEEKIPSNIDFIKYAHKVNDDKYKKGDFGYSSWYNKKKSIEAFQFYIEYFTQEKTITLGNLKLETFNNYINYRLNTRKNTSKEGINKTLVPLYVAVQYAVDNGEVELKDVSKILDNYVETRQTKYSNELDEKKIRYLRPAEMEKFYAYCQGLNRQRSREIADIFFFAFYACGQRVSDLMTLEWDNIDFERRVMNKVQFKTKMRPKVLIPLSDAAIEILKRWKRYNRNKRFVFDLIPADFNLQDENRVFMRRNAIDKTFNRSLLTISRNAKMPFTVTMHTARHSFAVKAINEGVSLHMLSQLLGHTSTTATELTYAEFLQERVNEDVKAIINFNLAPSTP